MKILIIGCGRVGAGLADTLTSRGHSVTVVDKEPLAFEKLGERFEGTIQVSALTARYYSRQGSNAPMD
jgi:trk system potassium uptake protein TrkA